MRVPHAELDHAHDFLDVGTVRRVRARRTKNPRVDCDCPLSGRNSQLSKRHKIMLDVYSAIRAYRCQQQDSMTSKAVISKHSDSQITQLWLTSVSKYLPLQSSKLQSLDIVLPLELKECCRTGDTGPFVSSSITCAGGGATGPFSATIPWKQMGLVADSPTVETGVGE